MKHWPFFFGGLITLIGIVIAGFLVFQPKSSPKLEQFQPEPQQVPPPAIDTNNRPFFSFAPRGDGKAIQISVSGILPDSQIDYEITYTTAAGLQQGIGGPVATEPGQSFYTREHIFGTCSKNICTYDKGVEFGKWKASIQQNNQVYELAGEWRLQQVGNKAVELGFVNKFKMVADVGTFVQPSYVITAQNSSLPKKLPDGVKLLSGPFTLASSERLSFKKPAQVTFSTDRETIVQILQIGPTLDWQAAETKFERFSNTVTAQTSTSGTFVLVEKI